MTDHGGLWPLFDLVITTPRLTLRVPGDDDLFALATLAMDGVHDPAVATFADPWSTLPPRARAQALLRRHWLNRAEWTPDRWRLSLVVMTRDGAVVGCHELVGDDFGRRGVVETVSWIGHRWQNQGFGQEARAAVLTLAFRGLTARLALMAAFVGNAASLRMARSLGYEDNGVNVDIAGEQAHEVNVFRMSVGRWQESAARHTTVELANVGPCRSAFGVA